MPVAILAVGLGSHDDDDYDESSMGPCELFIEWPVVAIAKPRLLLPRSASLPLSRKFKEK